MFDNIGGKIKAVAKVVFYIMAIASVIGAIVCFCVDEDLIFAGICVLIGGVICAWLSVLLLYGFGELIERTAEIAEIINPENASKAQENRLNNVPEFFTNTPSRAQRAANQPHNVNANTAPMMANADDDGNIVCPKCGTKQKSDRKVCWSCGQNFLTEMETYSDKYSDWSCKHCGQINKSSTTQCKSCGKYK